MNNQNRFCVYLHKINDKIVYIGSGTIERVKSKKNRTEQHLDCWNKIDFEIVKDELSKSESFKLEQELLDKLWSSSSLLNRSKTVNKVKRISFKRISELFVYDEGSPTCLFRVSGKNGLTDRVVAGTKTGSNYSRVYFDKKYYGVHRVVYCLCNKIDLDSDLVIDHIDGNNTNNKISNLRLVSHSENMKNKIHKKSNTGIQNLFDDPNYCRYVVSYSENYRVVRTCFSYRRNGARVKQRWYCTKELALSHAISFQKEMIAAGKIILVEHYREQHKSNTDIRISTKDE